MTRQPLALQGAGVLVRAGAGWLDFSWDRGADGRWGRDGRVSLRSERCWALSVRPYGHDGGVRLVFRFAPGPDGTDGGGVTVEADVGAERAYQARHFAAALARMSDIGQVTWSDVPEPGSEPEQGSGSGSGSVGAVPGPGPDPGRVPADGPDWLHAPASRASEALFAWVTGRVAEAAGA